MHPEVLTPTMLSYYGIKDSHRSGVLTVEPDADVNAFLEDCLALERGAAPLGVDFADHASALAPIPPGLLDGDTAMGNCVTSAWFQGFKVGQKARMTRAASVLGEIGRRFQERFGRPGIAPLEQHEMDGARLALVCMGPDAGTAVQLLPELASTLGVKVGLLVVRLVTPFPSAEVARALAGVDAIGVVNNAHHHGRGHLTADVADALIEYSEHGRATPPVEAFFCGLGGADVSMQTWRAIAAATREAGQRGAPTRRWHLLHDGVELEPQEPKEMR
jgi:hypothetical protein